MDRNVRSDLPVLVDVRVKSPESAEVRAGTPPSRQRIGGLCGLVFGKALEQLLYIRVDDGY